MTDPTRPTRLMNRSLMHTAARLHYVEGISQMETARRMQVSTATVSRLLSRARDEGIVRIQVIDLDEADEIGDRLRAALPLRQVRVLESDRVAALASQVGALLAEAALPRGAVLAVGWGRTVQGVISAGLPALPGAVVVPTTGGMHQTASHFQINEFVRMAAEQMAAEPRLLYAPSLPSPELHAALLRDPQMAHVMECWDRVDAAIVGIGAFRSAASRREVGFPADRADRIAGDVVRHYFDVTGAEIAWPGQDRLMAMSCAQLRRVPLGIGVATGRDKVDAIIGAARSRMINALVTDTRTAGAVLDALDLTGPEDMA